MAFTTFLIISSIASYAYSAYQQHKAGQEAKKAGELQQAASNDQASLQDFNAKVADLQATDALERGAEQESRYRTQVRGAIGAQRAGFAGANIDVGYGSAVDVQADAAYLGELDALSIRHNAARESWGYGMQAEDLRRGAAITRKTGVYQAASGRQIASAANYAAAGTLLGGTVSALQARYGYGRNP